MMKFPIYRKIKAMLQSPPISIAFGDAWKSIHQNGFRYWVFSRTTQSSRIDLGQIFFELCHAIDVDQDQIYREVSWPRETSNRSMGDINGLVVKENRSRKPWVFTMKSWLFPWLSWFCSRKTIQWLQKLPCQKKRIVLWDLSGKSRANVNG